MVGQQLWRLPTLRLFGLFGETLSQSLFGFDFQHTDKFLIFNSACKLIPVLKAFFFKCKMSAIYWEKLTVKI